MLGLGLGEIATRLADGRGVFGGTVYLGTPQIVPIDDAIRKIDAGRPAVGALWRTSPPPLANRGKPSDRDLAQLKEFGDKAIPTEHSGNVTSYELFKVWNAGLAADVCNHDVLKHLVRWPLRLFDPPGGELNPRFRFPPNATLPTGLVTNQAGWRGKRIESRTPRTIRIVFIGASTIAEAHEIPWSAPELVEEWLNAWARNAKLDVDFQVLNAGREGAMVTDVGVIVRDEVIPLRPDLVVFYEGALEFDWSSLVDGAAGLKALPRPDYEEHAGWVVWLAQRSSLFNRVLSALHGAGVSIGQIGEPAKPDYRIAWPSQLDEANPVLEGAELPLNLTGIMAGLEKIRLELKKNDIEFALSSFSWLVEDGLKLDPVQGRYIWDTNNGVYWPWRYADIRRGVDFENRVYRTYAATHGVDFLDVARLIPQDPSLFADGVHMTESGIRVKGWAFFRELLPVIEKHLKSGAWPRKIEDQAVSSYTPREQRFTCK